MILHFDDLHPNKRPFLCEYENCGASFDLRSDLRIHLKQHNSEDNSNNKLLQTFKCTRCYKSYSNKAGLDEHLKFQHTKTGDQILNGENKLLNHEHRNLWKVKFLKKMLEDTTDPLNTEIVKSEHDIMEKLIETCGEQRNCYICDRNDFKSDTHLAQHFKSDHSNIDEKPFPCLERRCDRTHNTRQQQKMHMINFHLKALKKNANIIPVPSLFTLS